MEKELKRKRKKSEKIVLETDSWGTDLAVPGFTRESESPAELEETPVAKRKKKAN